MIRIALATLGLLFANCATCPPPPIPGPADAGVGGGVIFDPDVQGDQAEAACKKLEELQCLSTDGRPLWETTPGGVLCADVFRNAVKHNAGPLPACIAKIKSCDERLACSGQ